MFNRSVNPALVSLEFDLHYRGQQRFYPFLFILLEHSLFIVITPSSLLLLFSGLKNMFPHLHADTCVGDILFPDVMSFPPLPLFCVCVCV